jgi:four helix bundle protein
MMKIKTYRDLIAWQKARMLVKEIYLITAQMPNTERFGLMMQMRRAEVSIPSNIAEGYARQSRSDYVRFLRMARGSLAELQTQLIVSEDLRYVEVPKRLGDLIAETDRVLQGLIRSLESPSK